MSVTVGVNERLQALTAAGTSVWLDQIRRSLIEGGELQRLIDEDSLRGVTSNPAIFEKAILGSDGYDGYVSLEVMPDLAHDTEATLAQAREYWRRVDRPNVMIKIPGTDAGLPAIEQSISEGINVNVTLLFSV